MKIDGITEQSYQQSNQIYQTKSSLVIEEQTESTESTDRMNYKSVDESPTKIIDEKKNNDEKDIIYAIEKANKHIKMYDRRLEFSIHDVTKQIMVKVIDTDSDKVIREIPSEKILDIVGRMWQITGILVDEKR